MYNKAEDLRQERRAEQYRRDHPFSSSRYDTLLLFAAVGLFAHFVLLPLARSLSPHNQLLAGAAVLAGLLLTIPVAGGLAEILDRLLRRRWTSSPPERPS